jgi:hypothetical protein
MTKEQSARLEALIADVVNAELGMSKADRMHTYIATAERAQADAKTELAKFIGELTIPEEAVDELS